MGRIAGEYVSSAKKRKSGPFALENHIRGIQYGNGTGGTRAGSELSLIRTSLRSPSHCASLEQCGVLRLLLVLYCVQYQRILPLLQRQWLRRPFGQQLPCNRPVRSLPFRITVRAECRAELASALLRRCLSLLATLKSIIALALTVCPAGNIFAVPGTIISLHLILKDLLVINKFYCPGNDFAHSTFNAVRAAKR